MTGHSGRRRFLAAGLSVVGYAVAGRAGAVSPPSVGSRSLALHNLHTGESIDVAYWADGSVVPDALARIDHLLRDFRTGETHPVDRRLLDLLVELNGRLDTREPFRFLAGNFIVEKPWDLVGSAFAHRGAQS